MKDFDDIRSKLLEVSTLADSGEINEGQALLRFTAIFRPLHVFSDEFIDAMAKEGRRLCFEIKEGK